MLINKSIYFVHIPRTGGKHVKELFAQNNYDFVLGDYLQWNNKETAHLCYPDYEIFLNFLECQKFTIVRNPLDRFISGISDDSRFNEETINKILVSQSSLNMYLNNIIFHDLANRFTPQINFLNNSIKIYNYENGLKENFFEWIKDNFNLQLKDVTALTAGHNFKIDLSNKEKQFIENYYYQDYKILNY